MALDLDFNQKRVVDFIRSGINIFITGEAGTGKSRVLSHVRSLPNFKHGVYFTAPTGIAANNIGGSTIHSFAGIGVGHGTPLQCLERVKRNQSAIDRWLKCRVLVVDEISLVSKSLFEKLDFIARKIRSIELPFGGIQLVFSGDFFQLRPVTSVLTSIKEQYCFESDVWKEAIKINVKLTTIHRQKEGDDLLNVLRDMRVKSPSLLSIAYLRSLRRPITGVDESECTTLFSKKVPCQIYNDSILEKLDGEEYQYKAKDSGVNTSVLKTQCNAPTMLRLKCGARVVLLKNLSRSLVNGIIGKVVYFTNGYPVVQFNNDETLLIKEHQFVATHPETAEYQATRVQLPLQLGWGVTIHKSQGMTIKNLRVCLSELFEPGQAYTALSRAVSGQSTQVVSLDSTLLTVYPDKIVTEFYDNHVKPAEDFANLPIQQPDIASTDAIQRSLDHEAGGNSPDLSSYNPASELENDQIIIDYEESLPEEIIMEVVDNIMASKVLSDECRDDLQALLHLHDGTVTPAMSSYISWLWKEVHILSNVELNETEYVTCKDAKFWDEMFYPKMHSLLISDNARKIALSSASLSHIEKKLTADCAKKTGLEEMLADRQRLYHRMTLVNRTVYKTFIQHVFLSTSPQPPPNNANQDIHSDLTPEMKGTLRYVAGWVLHKELKRSTAYILKNAASKNKNVLARRKLEVEIRDVLLSLKGEKSVVADPETMSTIMRRDRGALTNVCDQLYQIFELIQRRCDSVLTLELLNAIDVNSAIARARSEITRDPLSMRSWTSLLSSVRQSNAAASEDLQYTDDIGLCDEETDQNAESEDEWSDGAEEEETLFDLNDDEPDIEELFSALCDEQEKKQGTISSPDINSGELKATLEDILYHRMLNRFLKVQLKSWGKKIVQSFGKEKAKALREKLSASKVDDTHKSSSLKMKEIIDDTTANKVMSYTYIKFSILRDRSALKAYKRQELQLLFLAFGMRFPNLNKATLCDLLSNEVIKTTEFLNPQVLTSEDLELLGTKGGYKTLFSRVRKQSSDVPVVNDAGNTRPCEAVNQSEPTRKKRRPNFNPKEEDMHELLTDVREGKTTPTQARYREQQLVGKGYDVDFRQIIRWYKAHSNGN